MWTIDFYSPRVEKETFSLPTGLAVRLARYLNLIAKIGPDLGMPHTKAMGHGLFELRVSAQEGIARVFYCVVIDRRIVILHSFVKKTQQTPKHELEIARRRMKEYKR